MQKKNPTRRQVLQGAATAALAAPMFVPASALGRDGNAAPSERINIGCIGVGGMGRGNMGVFLGMNEVRVVAVCDVDENHVNQAADTVNDRYDNEDCARYSDFRELLARDDIDAVMIGTPDNWHGLIGIAAARAGKDIYCEKPITQTHEEGVALVKAVRENDIIWQTGSQQRSASNFRRGVELVLNGVIGRLRHVVVGLPTGRESPQHNPQDPPDHVDYDFYCGPSDKIPFDPERFHFHWRWNLNFGGGQMMDWINHHNDIAHWGMGMDDSGPLDVTAEGEFPPEGSTDNAARTYNVDCLYPNGVTTNISNSNPMGARFEGDDGWVYVNRGQFEASNEEWLSSEFEPGNIQAYRSNNHHRNFIECVKSRRQPICPPETALRACTPGYLAYASMFTGRKVKWNPATQQVVDDSEAAKHLEFHPRGDWSLDIEV